MNYKILIHNFHIKTRQTIMFFALLFATSLFAQKTTSGFKITKANLKAVASTGYVRCATVEYEQKLAEENPNKASEEVFESWMSTKIAQVKNRRITSKLAEEVYTIPVVVHVIHNGDEVNSPGNAVGENISDAQVISQIEVLNQDFRRLVNTPGGLNSTGLAVDVGIEFVLAKQDPNGLETKGIVRHNITPYTDDVENEPTNNVGGGGADWETYEDIQRMKTETLWDPTKYFNIWTVRTGGKTTADNGLSDLLGLAQFPSNSSLEGLNDNEGSAITDGVVLAFHAFGDSKKSDGSFIMNNEYNEGRTTTHEVGHWLGLRHIWGDTDTCGNDDYCADTPDATEGHTDCDFAYDTCSEGLGKDMVENYMDYTTDTCMDTFTQNQKDRMVAVMNNSPRRVDLLTSTALDEPLYSNDELKDFVITPNPVSNVANIVGFANGNVKLSLFDANGKVILYETYQNVDHILNQELDLNFLRSGVYLMLIENEGKQVVKRMIKS